MTQTHYTSRLKSYHLLVYMCLAIILSGCGAVRSLMGSNPGTVSSLWADVPPFEGSVKAELTLPTPVKLLIQSVTNGRFDFIAYTTPKLPAQIQAFYTIDRMKTYGWNATSTGCIGDKNSVEGGLCIFTRKDGNRDITLIIVLSHDDPPNTLTSIYYARTDTTLNK